MNWKTLKNRYPEIWEEVYSGVLNDLTNQGMPGSEIEKKDVIAHNAAFITCDVVRKNKHLIDIDRK